MKRILFILLAGVVLAACSDEEPQATEQESTVEDAKTEETAAEPSQEELNAQLKEEAIEIDFVSANGDEIEKGARVKATGEVSNLVDDILMEFSLTTEEGEGYGMYSVKGFNTTDASIADGQTVTVYGTYAGKNNSGMPEISVTVIE